MISFSKTVTIGDSFIVSLFGSSNLLLIAGISIEYILCDRVTTAEFYTI